MTDTRTTEDLNSRTRLQRILEPGLTSCPDRLAIRFHPPASAEPVDFSYRELDRFLRSVAAGLLARGIEAGDRVALFLPNCPEAVITMLSCYHIGAIAVPLNYRYRAPEAEHVLKRIDAKLLIYDQTRKSLVESLRHGPAEGSRIVVGKADYTSPQEHFDTLLNAAPVQRHAPLQEHHPALILFTSGSTGHPKGVVHSHYSAFSGIDISRRITEVDASDTVLVGKPISHAGGLETQLMPTLMSTGKVVLTMTPTPEQATALILENGVTQYALLASDLLDFIEYLESEPTELTTLKNSIGSGDAVPHDLHHRFRDLFGWEVMEGCGMTEIGTYYVINPRRGRRKWGSMGVACPDTRLRIVDDSGKDVRQGETGEILVRSPAGTPGYWNDAHATAELYMDGWLHTGDLAYSDEDGYCWFVSRKKLMIVRRGSNIAPAEVENVLDEHPGIHASVVVGLADRREGAVPVAAVAPIDSSAPPSEDDLRAYVRERLATYKNPVHYVFLNELPRTGTGKFDRVQLKQIVEQRLAAQEVK